MAMDPIVALEIGTSKVAALVAEMREDGHVMITGMGEHPATGVRKGEIIDLENAVTGVRAALGMAEESGKLAIRQVHLVSSGGHVQSLVNRGAIRVLSREHEISHEDIEQVMEVARAVNLPADREIMHTICQHFSVDDQARVIKPEGMEGAKLALDMLVVHGVRARLHNTIRVARSVPIGVQDVAFGGLCSALAVLTPEQKRSGALVIDLGGGTTDYLAYAGAVVASAGALGVGGDHITNDIALAFNIPTSRAERLKCESGSAVIGAPVSQRISLPAEVGFPGRKVSLHALHTVINARADEMVGAIRERLSLDGILHHIGAGVVLTGGGAHLKGMTELAGKVFGLPCSVGIPRGVTGLATATGGPQYAACSGLALYAFKTLADQRRGSWLGSLLRGVLGR